jgi:redox-sensitive bicupin YhaK (pirin superfamily)
MNDDLVQPSRGFGAHPHRDAEIVTYIVQGQLTHKDSMGTRETLGPGSVQFMTAGSGVTHSEHNLDAEHPLRFIQMWFTPRRYRPPPPNPLVQPMDGHDSHSISGSPAQLKRDRKSTRLNSSHRSISRMPTSD